MSEPSQPKRIDLTSGQEDFLKKEADKLNSEVEKLLEETRSREKYSLTIIAGVAAWVFTNLDKPIGLLMAVSCIPLITTLIYGLSVKYLYENIKWIGTYLRRIEDYFLYSPTQDGMDNTWGWEKYFDSENKKSKFVRVTLGTWILQLLLAIALLILVCCKDCFIEKQQAHKCTKTHHANKSCR